ncbi:DUF2252 domain-containing protein [Tsukamurella paurometabola]|uniref:Uncharacterized protein conserved in bacteria n=1 Tax=Tsukamurella paurometabola TaxID=2061 RepID=A0A3P8K703_TSUPA|nr:DUF2252 domain-containing protein [Tsukamurella paurometabola]UEA83437.1 DUF2252 domain-containing protein [Tsukamurella paurometabola]VDR40554.1 Uncharacterized protein conserved in bacteria [Tsukamurella paurometabola]
MSADAPNGKDLRKRVPRSAQAAFTPDGRDPVDIIREQNSTRIQELVPVRISRMLHSPFSFYRGGAALMAHDLAGEADTGVTVMSCGDAHISNFGLFASPERRQLFDVNDFDEAGNAPWEWDVKRLAASVMIAARENGYTEDQARGAVVSAAGAYRTTLAGLVGQSAVDRYYLSVDVDRLTAQAADDQSLRDLIEQTAKKARKRTSARMVEKITATSADGEPHIVADPPTLVPAPAKLVEGFEGLYAKYLDSIRADAAQLLGQFRVLDWALRVVGVGSVGTRCFIVLLGRDVPGGGTETLFLQVKEATQSVLQTYGKLGPSTMPPRAPSSGAQAWRVVAGQQILQAQSDSFLGYTPTIRGKDFYWRQFRDMKGSVVPELLTHDQFERYGQACAAVLARAHAQSPGSATASAYLGKSAEFEEAVAKFATAYADQNEKDYAAVQAAVKAGVLPCAEPGV